MPVTAWIAIGTAAVLALSVIASLAVAAVLGSISREVSELLAVEPYGLAPRKQAKATPARA
jgi:hypothetical protein